MKFSSYCVASTLLLAGSLAAIALADDAPLASRAGLPLEQTASRGIITRDPSTILKCKDEFWVFYTGRGFLRFIPKIW
jgi:arabinan endo-1,5-alpha-L-arabinosidase